MTTASSPTGSGSTSASPVTVPTPKIGGLTASGKPWTGGQPNPGWTSSTSKSPASPYCLRDEEDMKLYKFRTAAPTGEKKAMLFRRDDKKLTLRNFADEVLKHLETTGMDSVFYVPDPLEPTVMLNVITHHSRFTVDMVSDFVSKLTDELDPNKPKFDDFDIDNLKISRLYLENVLEVGLLNDLRATAPRDMTGPEFWMCLVAEVQSDSLERLRQIEANIKTKMVPASYPGENISKMSLEIVEACHELEVADTLPQDIILQIVNNFIKCSVETFKHRFLNRRSDVIKYLKRIRGKDKSVIASIPISDRITYRTLCKEAMDEYKELIDTKLWGPAGNAGDSGDAPNVFLAEVRKLVQDINSRGKKEVKCFHCKEPGHVKTNCPKLQSSKSANPTDSTPQQSTPPASTDGSTKTRPWFRIPPAPNAPETIKRGEKDWHWCAKCKKWCPSHGTREHKSPEERQASSQPAPQANTASTSSASGSESSVGLAACGW